MPNPFDHLATSMALPRTEAVSIKCNSCGHLSPAGICDGSPTLPIHCQSCNKPLDAATVLLANVKLARVEIDQLAQAVGTLLAALAVAYEINPNIARKPHEALERTIDIVALDMPALSVAKLHAAIFSGSKQRR